MTAEFHAIQVDTTGFTADAYNDVDLDDAAYSAISNTVTGLIVLINNQSANDITVAVRNKDHTTDYIGQKDCQSNGRFITPVGVDSARIFQVWASDYTDGEFWILVGTEDENQWHGTDYDTSATEPDDISPSTLGSFQDMDITSITVGGDVATGAFGQIVGTINGNRFAGVRNNGETIDMSNDSRGTIGYICPVDGDEIFEALLEDLSSPPEIRLLGYCTDGLNDSGLIDAVPASEDTYLDHTLDGGSSALGGVFCVTTTNQNRDWLERPNGETTGLWAQTATGEGQLKIAFRACGADGSGIVELRRNNATNQYSQFREVATFRTVSAGTSVSSISSMDVSWLAGASKVGELQVTSKAGVSSINEIPVSSLLEVSSTSEMPVDHLAGVSPVNSIPASWKAERSFASEMPASWKVDFNTTRELQASWLGSVSSQHETQASWLAGISAVSEIPVSWRGALVVSAISEMPVDWLGGISAQSELPVSFLLGASAVQDMPVSWLGSVSNKSVMPVSWPASLRSIGVIPVSWRGAVVVSAISDMPVDWLAGVSSIDELQVDFSLGLSSIHSLDASWLGSVGAIAELQVSSLANIRSINVIPVSWKGAQSVSAISDMPIDWLAGRAVTGELQAAWKGSVSSTSLFHVSSLASLNSISSLPASWLGGAALISEIPISWRAPLSVQATGSMPVDWLAGTSSKNESPVDWTTGFSTAFVMPVSYVRGVTVGIDLPIAWVGSVGSIHELQLEWDGANPFVPGNPAVFLSNVRGTVFIGLDRGDPFVPSKRES